MSQQPLPDAGATPPPEPPKGFIGRASRLISDLAKNDRVKAGFAILVVVAAVWLVWQALRETSLPEVIAAIQSTSPMAILAAIALTPAAYACLAVTEAWAVASVGKSLKPSQISFVTFVAYAMSNGLGLSVVSGAAARLRIYSAWGLTAGEIAAVTLLTGVAVTVTGFATAGLVVMFMPGIPIWARIAAFALACVALIRLAPLPRPIGWFPNLGLTPPPMHLRVTAFLSGTLDWILSGLCLFVLIPGASMHNVLPFIAIYVLGSAASAISGVPGGLGVFDAIVLYLSQNWHLEAPSQTAAALVLYRLIFAVAPLGLAGVAMVVWTIRHPRRAAGAAPPPSG